PMRLSVLAPNLKGLERAAAAGASEVAIVLSATDTMNRRNINMGLDEALRVSLQTLGAAIDLGLRTRAYVAVAFECPFEGRTPAARVRELAVPLLEAGANEIVIADTIGAAAPGEVRRLLDALLPVLPVARVGMHFHDTRGMGVANAFAALQMGIRRLDASTGGVGGCPFAPGASGNVATEDLVLMAEQSGYRTGISLPGLVAAVDLVENLLGSTHGGGAMPWLRRMAAQRRTEPLTA
ncbi:MAG: hydroxymethylglutaryl-CoA lyase, partial [Gammaproteobacteria bacterium]|nr:hydroxymethylglutaryl-CoA lyase [Gammaproteobacteria bacterium]